MKADPIPNLLLPFGFFDAFVWSLVRRWLQIQDLHGNFLLSIFVDRCSHLSERTLAKLLRERI
jgi:hypothetical protein